MQLSLFHHVHQVAMSGATFPQQYKLSAAKLLRNPRQVHLASSSNICCGYTSQASVHSHFLPRPTFGSRIIYKKHGRSERYSPCGAIGCSDGSEAGASSDRPSPEVVEGEEEAADEGTAWEADFEDKDVRVLAKFKSLYNFVQVLEVCRRADHPLAGSKLLLLDRPGNIQSVYHQYKVKTDSYYDLFATLPPLLPGGPVGILGLGAGTSARIIQHFWPHVQLHGWELDPSVVMVARQYFDLSELEEGKLVDRRISAFSSPIASRDAKDVSAQFSAVEMDYTGTWAGTELKEPARLIVHVGDALSSKATVDGGFAGLIVDMFSDGAVIPALQQPQTWQRLKEQLRPGGRIMVNCGGSCVEAVGKNAKDGEVTMEETIAAIAKVFPDKLSRIKLRGKGSNSLALTGPPPEMLSWEKALPDVLREGVHDWISVFSY